MKNKILNILLLLFVAGSMNSCRLTNMLHMGIPVIGVDDKGNIDTNYIPKSIYRKRISQDLSDINQETLLSLDRVDTVHRKKRWKVTMVTVGLGIGFEVGLLPVLGISVEPSFRLFFIDTRELK